MMTNALIFHLVATILIVGLLLYCAFLLSNLNFLRRSLNTQLMVDYPERFLKRICSILQIPLDLTAKTPENAFNKLTKIHCQAFLRMLLSGSAHRIDVKTQGNQILVDIFVRQSNKSPSDIAHLLGDSIVVRWNEAN